jgi:hypothetical protein
MRLPRQLSLACRRDFVVSVELNQVDGKDAKEIA